MLLFCYFGISNLKWILVNHHKLVTLDTKKYAGGRGEIRTHGEFPHGGFQDRCLKPLGHPS